MTTFRSVRVAAVQATQVVLDAEGCVAKAEELMRTAADDGAELIVLPECFIPFYPLSRLTRSDWDPRQTDLYERMWLNAVDVPGPITDRLAAVCAELDVHVAIGVNERESDRPGTLYNSLLLIGPTGVLRSGLRAKYSFDAIGHYSREELLLRVLGSGELRGEPAGDVGSAFPALHAGH